LDKISQYSGT